MYHTICVIAVALVAGPVTEDKERKMTEKEKIEALIKHVERLKDAKFTRNDVEYDAETAAKFLRGKWESREKEVKTAMDFIEKVGSASSTSGKPYTLQLKDGKPMKSGAYLREQLKKLNKSE